MDRDHLFNLSHVTQPVTYTFRQWFSKLVREKRGQRIEAD